VGFEVHIGNLGQNAQLGEERIETMKRPEEGASEHRSGRRDFLKLAAISGPVAAAAVAGGSAAEAAEPDLASNKMQDTAHTRAYFDSARF
jgi:hypothetical protein